MEHVFIVVGFFWSAYTVYSCLLPRVFVNLCLYHTLRLCLVGSLVHFDMNCLAICSKFFSVKQ